MSLYVVGKIVGCFGIRGAVKVQPVTHDPGRFKLLESVSLGSGSENVGKFKVAGVELRKNVAVMRFAGIETRSAAEELVGKFVFVHDEEIVEPELGTYFTHDIIGSEVYTVDRRFLGTIEDVQRFPAQDVWILRQGEKRSMIPAVKEFVKSVDVVGRKIVIDVIEGLIDE